MNDDTKLCNDGARNLVHQRFADFPNQLLSGGTILNGHMRSGCYKIYPLKDICKLPLENQHKHVVTSHTELSWEGTLILVMPKDHYYCHAQFSIEILKDFSIFGLDFQ